MSITIDNSVEGVVRDKNTSERRRWEHRRKQSDAQSEGMDRATRRQCEQTWETRTWKVGLRSHEYESSDLRMNGLSNSHGKGVEPSLKMRESSSIGRVCIGASGGCCENIIVIYRKFRKIEKIRSFQALGATGRRSGLEMSGVSCWESGNYYYNACL
jgi:hypothetical protein